MLFHLDDGLYLSAIGPGQDWRNMFDRVGMPFGKDLIDVIDTVLGVWGMETTGVKGDGIDTWEVSLRQKTPEGDGPYRDPVWEEQYRSDLSTDNWAIYGFVPTDVVVEYIKAHGGDPQPLVDFVRLAKEAEDGDGIRSEDVPGHRERGEGSGTDSGSAGEDRSPR